MKIFNFDSFILNEKILLENRIENLENKYKNILHFHVISWLESHDPTPNDAYLEWMLKKYSTMENFEKEKFEKLKTPIYKTFTKIIKKFNNIKEKFSPEERDINHYKNISQLLYKVSEEDKDYSNETIKKYGKVDIHANNEEWLIFTPYDFEVAEEYGHNNRGGKNWCVCYEQDYFYEYLCPDGGITMIINKLDPKLDLAIQKSLHNYIILWDYNDESVSNFNSNSDGLKKYLKKHGDYEFVIDYFNENKLVQLSITIDDLKDYWIDLNRDNWRNLIETYEICDYLDYDCFSSMVFIDLNSSEKQSTSFIEEYFYKKFIEDNYSSELEKMDKDKKDYLIYDIDEMREFIINNDDWDLFFEEWYDEDVNETFLENIVEDYDIYELEDCINIEKFLDDKSEDEDEDDLINFYYQRGF